MNVQQVRVILADDHVMIRDALARLLGMDSQFRVAGVASNGGDALALIMEQKPDVAVLDIDMPGRTCFDIADVLRSADSRTRVVVLSGHARDFQIQMALQSGVSSYVTKDEPLEAIVGAIRMVATGKGYFSPGVRARFSGDAPLFGKPAGINGPQVMTGLSALSLREREVLMHLARGRSVKEVAADLMLSRKTVDNHTQRLMAKLDIHTRSDLVRYAIREAVVTP